MTDQKIELSSIFLKDYYDKLINHFTFDEPVVDINNWK